MGRTKKGDDKERKYLKFLDSYFNKSTKLTLFQGCQKSKSGAKILSDLPNLDEI